MFKINTDMKNLILFFLPLLFIACTKEVNQVQDAEASKATVRQAIAESGVRNLVRNKEGKTWQDVDAFYRQLPARFSDPEQLDFLKGYTIAILERSYHLSESTDAEALKAVEYYTKELLRLSYPHPDVMAHFLTRLKGHWSRRKIAKTARKALEKSENMAAASEGGNAAMQRHQSSLEQLKALANK